MHALCLSIFYTSEVISKLTAWQDLKHQYQLVMFYKEVLVLYHR